MTPPPSSTSPLQTLWQRVVNWQPGEHSIWLRCAVAVALSVPFLGSLADRGGLKKKFLLTCALLGMAFGRVCAALASAG